MRWCESESHPLTQRGLELGVQTVAPFDGLSLFRCTRHIRDIDTHVNTCTLTHAHLHMHIQCTPSHTHSQVCPQARRSRASVPSRKPVERQRSVERVPPLVWHEKRYTCLTEVKGCGCCRSLIRPQRQLLRATCDLVPPTAFWPAFSFLSLSLSLPPSLFFV